MTKRKLELRSASIRSGITVGRRLQPPTADRLSGTSTDHSAGSEKFPNKAVLPFLSGASILALCRKQYIACGLTCAAAACQGWRLFTERCPLQVMSVHPHCSSSLAADDTLLSINNYAMRYVPAWAAQRLLDSGAEDSSVAVRVARTVPAACSTLSSISQWPRRLLHVLQQKPVAAPIPTEASVLDIEHTRQALPRTSLMEHCALPRRCGEGIGYIRIADFNDETFFTFQRTLQKLKDKFQQHAHLGGRLQALVCDLRGNPGGSLLPALDIAGMFLPKGAVITQLRAHGCTKKQRSTNHSPDLHTALLLLTDARTASASEILVEALCDNQRAVSMGQRSVGKNFAQVRVLICADDMCM